MTTRCALVGFLCLLSAVGAWAASCELSAELSNFSERVPGREAEAGARADRVQLLAVAGYAIETPGVPGIAYCWLDAQLARVILDTSDAVCSKAHVKFQELALSFASRFNRRLFQLSDHLQHHACGA